MCIHLCMYTFMEIDLPTLIHTLYKSVFPIKSFAKYYFHINIGKKITLMAMNRNYPFSHKKDYTILLGC